MCATPLFDEEIDDILSEFDEPDVRENEIKKLDEMLKEVGENGGIFKFNPSYGFTTFVFMTFL